MNASTPTCKACRLNSPQTFLIERTLKHFSERSVLLLFVFICGFQIIPKSVQGFILALCSRFTCGKAQGTIYGSGNWSQVGFIKRQPAERFLKALLLSMFVFVPFCCCASSLCLVVLSLIDWQFKGDMLFTVVIIGEGCCWDVAALPAHNCTPVTTVVWAASPHIRAQPGSQTEVSLSYQARQHCPTEGDVTFSLNLSTEPHPVLASVLPFLLVRSIVNLLTQVSWYFLSTFSVKFCVNTVWSLDSWWWTGWNLCMDVCLVTCWLLTFFMYFFPERSSKIII